MIIFLSPSFRCDKTDYLRPLMMKVDRASEDLLQRYNVSEDAMDVMHSGRLVVSDDEDGDEIVQVDLGINDADIKTEVDEEMELSLI